MFQISVFRHWIYLLTHLHKEILICTASKAKQKSMVWVWHVLPAWAAVSQILTHEVSFTNQSIDFTILENYPIRATCAIWPEFVMMHYGQEIAKTAN